MVTILLVDDHKIVRQGLRMLLETQPDFRVIGEAASGAEALPLVGRLKPDVLVTDLIMDNMNGIELARKSKESSPRTEVVIISMYGDDAYVAAALDAGAKGYVLKESSADDLARAIRSVAKGRRFLSPPLSEERIQEYRRSADDSPPAKA